MHPQMKGTTDEREGQEDFEGCRIHRGAGRDVAADGMYVSPTRAGARCTASGSA
jgi:hypothetical protein